ARDLDRAGRSQSPPSVFCLTKLNLLRKRIMKYGIRNRALKMDGPDAMKAAAEIGFDGIELIVGSEEELLHLQTEEGIKETSEWRESSGCVISSLSVASFRQFHFALPDVPVERSVQFVETSLRAALACGGAGALLPHFEPESIDIDPAAEAAYIDGFRRCAPIAEELQIHAMLETSFSTEQLVRIIDGAGSPYIGVYQDVANALHYGHEPVAQCLQLGKRIPMIHIKEFGGDLLGEGDVDWDKNMEAIRQIGYDGWLVLETKPTDDPIQAAGKNLEFLKELVGRI
ncbi:MAG: sugar phosphate isomerase/epimerase family protein, partial [Planctomycetota bacterium]|nr:sugar phosphate isomerase/epimerase family protein [Planctomycetota bacterium]